MMEATAPARQPEPAEYVQIWVDSFSQVIGQITGSAIPSLVQADRPPDLPAAGEGDLWAVVTSSGALRGEMALRLSAITALRLAQIFTRKPVSPEEQLSADDREAVADLLRQVSGVVSLGLKARWGEVQLLVELAPAAPSWPSAGTFWLLNGEETPTGVTLEFGLSAALVAELRAERSVAMTDSSFPSAAAGEGTGALDRLMDVQLAMTLRFGAKQLLLRDVLDLCPGAVVELDRKIQEPVDLLLDGRLVARGEVVVIDGNYGLRVTDVTPLESGRTP
jgi:flagellar motor switch protein FliN/FliY